MITVVYTQTGSIYVINEYDYTWTRVGATAESAPLDPEHGRWIQVNLLGVGEPMVIYPAPQLRVITSVDQLSELEEKITTSPVIKIDAM